MAFTDCMLREFQQEIPNIQSISIDLFIQLIKDNRCHLKRLRVLKLDTWVCFSLGRKLASLIYDGHVKRLEVKFYSQTFQHWRNQSWRQKGIYAPPAPNDDGVIPHEDHAYITTYRRAFWINQGRPMRCNCTQPGLPLLTFDDHDGFVWVQKEYDDSDTSTYIGIITLWTLQVMRS